MIYLTTYNSPIGVITLACDGENLVGLWNEGQKYHSSTILKDETKENALLPVFVKTKKWLDGYFAGGKPSITELPLAPRGSDFRQAVWKILCEIPYGKTITYGEIAKKIAQKTNKKTVASQAVGGAVGHNPISIIIPCHRVVGANGSMTGYAAGIPTKIKLLELEGCGRRKPLTGVLSACYDLQMEIKRLNEEDLRSAMALVRRVSLQFVASDTKTEGFEQLKNSTSLKRIREKIKDGMLLWGAYDKEKIVGVIATKKPSHISLLFVDKKYHRQGIARALVNVVLKEFDGLEITLNSSPYALEIYKRLGFIQTGDEFVKKGLRMTPMKYGK